MVNESVLVLNRSWLAVNVANVRRAIALVYQDHARIVSTRNFATYTFDDWVAISGDDDSEDDRVLRTVNFVLRVPEVIVLLTYNSLHRKEIPFSRRSLVERDDMQCQYCGKKVRRHEFTVDHVVPRSRGGGNTWDNLVLACVPCNVRKGNRTPDEAGMPLMRKPSRPDWLLHGNGLGVAALKPSWAQFVGHMHNGNGAHRNGHLRPAKTNGTAGRNGHAVHRGNGHLAVEG